MYIQSKILIMMYNHFWDIHAFLLSGHYWNSQSSSSILIYIIMYIQTITSITLAAFKSKWSYNTREKHKPTTTSKGEKQ